ncbi:MAG: zinc-dependent alcohol dehydrogenase, partial [Acidimicrobiia bacterium]
MRALIFGVEPEPQPKPDTDNRLLRALARTPVRLVEMGDPGFLRPDWVVTKPRLTGICGSESKQVFFDYASYTSKDRGSGDNRDNPMKNFVSFP